MRICQLEGCGKHLPKNSKKKQKYCGSQDDKTSCSYQNLLNKMVKYREIRKTKICVDCERKFVSKSWNKTRCGSAAVHGTCAYKHKLELANELHKKRKEPKLKIIEKPKPEAIKPEIYITPRLAHLELIKKHNNEVKICQKTCK